MSDVRLYSIPLYMRGSRVLVNTHSTVRPNVTVVSKPPNGLAERQRVDSGTPHVSVAAVNILALGPQARGYA